MALVCSNIIMEVISYDLSARHSQTPAAQMSVVQKWKCNGVVLGPFDPFVL